MTVSRVVEIKIKIINKDNDRRKLMCLSSPVSEDDIFKLNNTLAGPISWWLQKCKFINIADK